MRLYKTACTKPIPPDAKIVIRNGVKCAKYKVKGKQVEYPLTKKGDRVRIEADHWSLQFRDRNGKKQTIAAFPNKKISENFGDDIEKYLLYEVPPEDRESKQKWIRDLAPRERDKLVEFGMIDTGTCSTSNILDELVNEFEGWLRQTRVIRHGFLRDKHTVQITMSMLKRIIESCGFGWWKDISKYKVEQYLGGIGKSKRTYNAYLMAIKQFCSWVDANEETAISPVRNIKRLTLDDEPYRRPLTAEEFTRLLDATAKARYRFGMTGTERARLYLLTAETGLRLNELRSLTVSSFDFEDRAVVVEKINSKNRKGARQFLRQDRIEPLRAFLRSKLPMAKAFNIPLQCRGSNMIRADLKEAGIPFQTRQGRFDFHAIRSIFSTAVSKTDAMWLEHKFLMRHSTKDDVTARYTPVEDSRCKEIIEQLPSYQWPGDMRLKATGS